MAYTACSWGSEQLDLTKVNTFVSRDCDRDRDPITSSLSIKFLCEVESKV
jgi:hypothetical protein